MSAWERQDVENGRAAAAGLLAGRRVGIGGVRLPDRPAAWTAFDEEVRRARAQGASLPCFDRPETRLCHRDGRIREAALDEPDPALPLVAIRCADWVPAVRKRARRLLGQALAADPARTLTDLTPLVLRLGRRGQGAWALERFEAALRAEDPVLAPWWRPARPATWWRAERPAHTRTGEEPDTVLAWLRWNPDLETRRFATRITLDLGLFGVRELARRAAVEQDPVTSTLWTDAALTALAAGAPGDGAPADGPDRADVDADTDADAAVDALLGGHLPMVRAAGVTALRRAGRAAEAVHHLTDRSGTVRACARWLLRQGGGDPYAHLRELVEDPDRIDRYVVTGFAECAGRADAPLLRALLDHPAGAVRAAAVAGLRHLDVTDLGLLRPLLDDPSPGVAREASLSLRASAGQLPADWLLARIAPGLPRHGRLAAYRVLHARGGVAGLRASVELLTDEDAGLRVLAGQRLGSLWSPCRPPALPIGDPEVGALLDRCTGVFSDYVLSQMRSQLGLPRTGSATEGH
ncbi:hypothetical protein AB0D29_27685 [Streptomyces sp. NPDC048424]|uniref:hypothetical protein n=1 Tax=Streptomyces sp. NPDC048424 TaxID=3155265 RepID=UPI0034424C5A